MVILARIWSAYYHHNKIVVAFKHLLVANGWLKQVAVFVNPFFKVERF